MTGREFTGRHMAVIIISFLGVVIAVNLLMASFATRTFGGTVVDNSYVASQRFNGWLQEAREQAQLQWTADISTDPMGHLVAQIHGAGGAVAQASLEAHATHPLGRQPERRLSLAQTEPGTYRSSEPLPSGRWIIRLSVRQGEHEARYVTEVRR